MEPPIGYGSTHRSIFPVSQFGTTAAPCFREASLEKKLIDASAHRGGDRGAWATSC